MNQLFQLDCMDYMKDISNNHFDLTIVDPEYGIGESGGKDRRGKSKHIKKDWDNKRPSEKYFQELFRVSKNQIIWGSNYFVDYLLPSMGWICWDKKLDNSDFSDFELAYTSFERAAKIFRYSKNGGSRTPAALADIIHPTQKPISLYKWLLTNYAKPGDKLFDSHSGSGSFRIAAHDLGFDLVSCELDTDYCRDNETRFQRYIQQHDLFKPEEIQKLSYKQSELI